MSLENRNQLTFGKSMITDDIDLCVEALTNGELVAFPTETVYGLGARADSALAVSKIYEAKGRPKDHPLIMHCASVDVALAISPHVHEYARKLAQSFWPGPMTLIFERGSSDAICDEAVGGHSSVAVRVPSNEIARQMLEPCSFFVAAPSANRFGKVSPTTAKHVQDEFGDEIIILNGDRSKYGLESTIISCIGEEPEIIRAGAISKNDIERVTGLNVINVETNLKTISAPGNLENHYSPEIPLLLVSSDEEITARSDFDSKQCAYIGGIDTQCEFKLKNMVSNYEQYAYELYDFFHQAQDQGCEAIFAVRPENEGIGVAINDRLTKAATFFGEQK